MNDIDDTLAVWGVTALCALFVFGLLAFAAVGERSSAAPCEAKGGTWIQNHCVALVPSDASLTPQGSRE